MAHQETASGIVIPPTYEEAKRCPKCKEPGEVTASKPAGLQGTLETVSCMNERCKWFETGWVIQVMPDGTIPVRAQNQPKQFHSFTAGQEANAKAFLHRIAQETGTTYNG